MIHHLIEVYNVEDKRLAAVGYEHKASCTE